MIEWWFDKLNEYAFFVFIIAVLGYLAIEKWRKNKRLEKIRNMPEPPEPPRPDEGFTMFSASKMLSSQQKSLVKEIDRLQNKGKELTKKYTMLEQTHMNRIKQIDQKFEQEKEMLQLEIDRTKQMFDSKVEQSKLNKEMLELQQDFDKVRK